MRQITRLPGAARAIFSTRLAVDRVERHPERKGGGNVALLLDVFP